MVDQHRNGHEGYDLTPPKQIVPTEKIRYERDKHLPFITEGAYSEGIVQGLAVVNARRGREKERERIYIFK